MSTLLEQASLIMIPSGYKEDVVYSVIPENGNGDLSFTRASNGTRVNSAGLVEVCPWNMCEYSEQLSNGVWQLASATIGTNATTAPNGTTTAESFTSQATLANHVVYQLLTGVSGAYTYSVYVKKVNSSYVYIKLVGDSAQWVAAAFDLNDGTLTKSEASGWTGLTASSESVGNGWYKLIVSGSGATSVNFNVGIQYTNTGTPTFSAYADASFTGTGTIDYYIWGAQLNIGSTAKPYFPTTDRLNVPRLTYQNGGGGCPSLLLEKQSTNYILQSQNFTSSWLFANLLYTANQAISPDGTQNATKLDNTTGNGQHRFFQQAFTGLTNETISFSLYAKQGTHRYISWGITDDSDYRGQVVVDLQTGTITDQFTTSATLSNLSVVSQGNGWYRISGTIAVSANYAGGSGYTFGLMLNSASWSTANYTGTETYFYGWGAQAELSSYPTSYIPTTSSSATRVADACFKTGISSLIGQTQGVLFVDLVITGTTGNNRFSISDGSNTNWIFIGTPEDGSNGGSRFYIKTNGSVHVDVGAASYFTIGQRYKLAIAYKSGDWAVYGNGVQLYSGTTAISAVSSPLSVFNFFNATGGNADCGEQVNETILFTTRLSNSELASLTSL